MCKLSLFLFFSLLSVDLPMDIQSTQVDSRINENNVVLQKDEWIWLFDGSSTEHWVGVKSGQFPAQGWVIEEDALVVNKGEKSENRGGDIITREKYGNFDLQFEFKLTPGANSGVKYFVKLYEDGRVLGCEYQLIDDEGNKDVANDPDGKRLTASLYELFAPEGKKLKPAGTWNKSRIVVQGNHVEHWLNEKKVVEYERGSEEFLAARAKSKFKEVADFGLIEEGYIMLTDHGDEVAYRNIRIRKL